MLAVLYISGLYCALLAGVIFLRMQSSADVHTMRIFRFPRMTIFLSLAIAIPSILQIFFPVLLPIFQRDYQLFLQGEWWRLVTPLFFQDGGIFGTIFNLICLLLIGSLAEQLWGSASMLMIFSIGGIFGEIIAFAWQPVGAGNSVGNFSLAAGIAVACLTRRPSKQVQIPAIAALCIYAILTGLKDIHGAASMMGALTALFISRRDDHTKVT